VYFKITNQFPFAPSVLTLRLGEKYSSRKGAKESKRRKGNAQAGFERRFE
jgi:hypothetical protein